MKSLSLSRPLVIMVIGLPGSGKSFFSRQFAEMFGAPLVSVDFIRHTISPSSYYSQEEDDATFDLAKNQTEELLKTGKTFIIDGGLNSRASRIATERLAAKYGYGKLTIWVQTDEPTSISRSMKRNAKRKYDELNATMDSTAFTRYRKQFSAPTPSENIVVISGKHTFATQARVILKKLVVPRDTTVAERQQGRETSPTKPEQYTDVQQRRRNITIN